MEQKVFEASFEVKAEGDSGEFSGYASVFGNTDLGGDVIVKNAFKEFVANGNGEVKVLYGHDSGMPFRPSTGAGGLPIGLATVEQNSKGLKFSGRLNMQDPFVQRVHSHMKFGSLDGMSIGYDVLPGGMKVLESGVRELSALKLWEVSPVVWGMNPKAHIATVKSLRTVREVEDLLREAMGLSRTQAKVHASGIWKSMCERDASLIADPDGERDAGEESLQSVMETLRRFGA